MKRVMVGICLLVSLTALYSQSPGMSGRTKWWDIRLHLTVNGRYAYDGPDRLLKGEFRYEVAWTGAMEKDGDDFILYHGRIETLGWKLREEDGTAGSVAAPLSERDTDRKPGFRMIYILGDGKRLRIYFAVDGFRIPLQEVRENFDLILPSSKSDAEDQSDYSVSIIKGCNDVVLNRKAFLERAVEQDFGWSWKRYIASEAYGSALTKAAAHDVELSVRITPRR
jgi:hypothetical protein